MSKPRVIKDFDKLDNELKQAIFDKYPYGFDKYIITFKNHKNLLVSALPFETEEVFFMVKMTRHEANEISSNRDQELEDDLDDELDDTLDDIEEIPDPDGLAKKKTEKAKKAKGDKTKDKKLKDKKQKEKKKTKQL
jgi:hypothetical protein